MKVPDTYISFSPQRNRVHIPVDALKKIGSPRYVRFLIDGEGKSMVMQPYSKKVFQSMRVPPLNRLRRSGMEVHCADFCRLLTQHLHWKKEATYRMPGKVYPAQGLIKFDLCDAFVIGEGQGVEK